MDPKINIKELKAGNRERVSQAPAAILVWRQLSKWTWESDCGRFMIERFIIGNHERIREDYQSISRYRVFRRNPEWDFEFAPNEDNLVTAKEVCEKFSV